MAVFFFIYPAERIKKIRDVFLFHTLAGILYRIPDKDPVDPLTFTADRESDRTLAGVFDCVIQQVYQNLLDAHLVATEHTWDGGVYVKLKLQPFFFGFNPNHVDNFRKKCAGLIRGVDDFHFSGFDFGYVQDIVDQGKQKFAGSLDIPGVLRHFLGNIAPQCDFVQPDNCIDGRSNLVAHAGKEMVFRLIEFFNLLFLLLSEGVFFFIHPVQEHQQYAGQYTHHNHG